MSTKVTNQHFLDLTYNRERNSCLLKTVESSLHFSQPRMRPLRLNSANEVSETPPFSLIRKSSKDSSEVRLCGVGNRKKKKTRGHPPTSFVVCFTRLRVSTHNKSSSSLVTANLSSTTRFIVQLMYRAIISSLYAHARTTLDIGARDTDNR